MTKLLLFDFLWLFPFVSAYSPCSDETYSLAKVFPQTKRRFEGMGDKDHRVLLCFTLKEVGKCYNNIPFECVTIIHYVRLL